MNDNIRKLGYFFIVIFTVLALYLGYLNAVVGPKLSADPHNRRLAAAEEAVVRGVIFDRQGVVLAEDRMVDGVKKRVYPRGRETAHLIGFVSQRYGRTGVESTFDRYLLAMDEAGRVRALVDRFLGRQRYGYNIVLTVDSRLQRKALNLLAGRKGAVVALDPRTGAVLAVVSSPSFDPGSVDTVVRTESSVQNGEKVEIKVTGYDILKMQTGDAPLLNRATRGVYPPGSVFKIITGAGALEANPDNSARVYECKGSIAVEGFVLKDFGVHGRVGLNEAAAVSCNTYFASLGLELGGEGLKRAAENFGFKLVEYDKSGRLEGGYPVAGDEIHFNTGTLPANKMPLPEVASAAIGQGRVLVSPFQMALVAAGVANGGTVMKPVVLERVVTRNGLVIKRMVPEAMHAAVSPPTARVLARAMEEAARTGTASRAVPAGIRVAGKTGSAQNPGGQTHAWFMGFAPADDPRIAVAVVVENGGPGATVAAPIAGEIMREYLGEVRGE
ncbi:MAG: cell division protein FtsI [Peptococcaceae bacterium]|nr:cell division protein FtsI [Peptococcaceae bacterium]